MVEKIINDLVLPTSSILFNILPTHLMLQSHHQDWIKHPCFHSTWAHLILEMKAMSFYNLFTDLYSPTRLVIFNHSDVIVKCVTNNLFLMVTMASTLKKTYSTYTIIESKSFLCATCVSEANGTGLDITILCATLSLKCLWKCPSTFMPLRHTELHLSLNF